MSSRKDLPTPSTPNWPQRVTEELRLLMGKAGGQSGRAITVGDLPNLGSLAPGGIGGIGSGGSEYVPDLTPPPTPSGFELSAAISHVFIEHDAPIYAQGNGHAKTQVYGAKVSSGGPLPTFSDAVLLTDFTGIVFAYPSDPATTWRMWITWVTRDDVESVVPAGGTNGLEVATGQDVGKLLDALTGQITESALFSALGARINLVDGTGAGSVNARVQAAKDAMQGQIDSVNAQLAEVIGASDFDSDTAYAAGDLVKYAGKLYRAKVGTVGNLPTNATNWDLVGEYASLGDAIVAHAAQLSEHNTSIGENAAGLTAEAAARDTLAAQLRGSYTGSDINALTQGLVFSERTARVTAVSAEAAARDVLSAQMRGAYTGTDVAALTQGLAFSERQARVAADAANATLTAGVRADLTAAQGTLTGHGTAIGTLNTNVGLIDGRVTAQASRVDLVEAGLGSSGADGLIADPEMVSGLTNWQPAASAANLTLFAASDAGVPAGAPAARLVRFNESAAGTLPFRKLRGAVTANGDVVRVTPGEKIDISVWVYCDGTDISLRVLHGVGTNPGTQVQVALATAASWTLIQGTFTVPEGSLHLRIGVRRALATGVGWIAGLQAGRRGAGVAAINAAVIAESAARATALEAEATARQTLSANIGGTSGENLILNPRFDPAGYRLTEATAFATTGYLPETDAAVPANAPCAIVMVREKIAASDATRRAVLPRLTNIATRLSVREGDVLDLSLWMAVTGGTTNAARILLVARNAAAASLGTVTAATYNNAVPGWQQLTYSYPLPANAATVELLISLEAVAPQGMKMFVGELDVRKRSAASTVLSAAVETEASVRASVDGYLGAQQTVRIDVAGHVAGYGLAGSTPNGSGASATSQFGVRANQFFVAPPAVAQAAAPTANLYEGYVWVDTSVAPNVTRYRSGATWTTTAPALPFIIQTTPTTINGVSVAAGVYMRDVFVMNGTITNAKMANLAVDDAKVANLSVSKILAGSMVVGQYINSATYTAGSQGWSINAAGNVEFNNAVIRGTVYASAGAIGGISIAAGAVQSNNYAVDSAGFYLGSDGSARFNNVRTRGSIMGGAYTGYAWPAAGAQGFYLGAEGLLIGSAAGSRYFQVDATGNVYAPNFTIVNGVATFSGALSAASGTFAGSLSAASGTFSGSLTANAINAVNSINVAGEAIVTSRYAQVGATSATNMVSQGVTMVAGSSGVVIHAVVTATGDSASEGSGANASFAIYKDSTNQPLASAGFSIGNASTIVLAMPISFTAHDPTPTAGWGTYSVRRATAGQSTTVQSASITLSGGKR